MSDTTANYSHLAKRLDKELGKVLIAKYPLLTERLGKTFKKKKVVEMLKKVDKEDGVDALVLANSFTWLNSVDGYNYWLPIQGLTRQ